MRPVFRTIMATVAVLFMGMAAFAQAPEETAAWNVAAKSISADEYEITFTASIVDGWHIYTVDSPDNPVSVDFTDPSGYALDGCLAQITEPVELDGHKVFFNQAVFTQKVKVTGKGAKVKGVINWFACNDQYCAPPEEKEFEVTLGEADDVVETAAAITPADEDGGKESGGLLGLIIVAILWG
ncbi:MAG: hypothetical protein KBS78_09075, partial [Bacteroidales bacterium]|nr:hypothetical protein [Candidatus Cryptobacteroides faecihippi]